MKACSYCGRQNEEIALQCSGCGTDFEEAKVAVAKLTTAGFKIRALARIVDITFCLCLAYVAGIFGVIALKFLSGMGLMPHGWTHRLHGFSLMAFAFAVLAKVSYHFFCEGLHGATLGKMFCGISVVRQDGRPGNLMGALVRSLGYYWDGLFFGMVGYHSMENHPSTSDMVMSGEKPPF